MATTLEVVKRLVFQAQSQGVDRLTAELTKLETAQKNTGQAALSAAKQFDSLERSLVPAARAQAQLEAVARKTAAALEQGHISAARAATVLAAAQEKYNAVTRQSMLTVQGAAAATGAHRGQLQQLSFQLNDMATMLASGSSPFQIMATQGGQVFQILQQGQGGVGGSIKALGGSILGLLTPARLAGGALVGIGAAAALAWNIWDDRIKAMQVSLNGLGRSTGLTTGSLMALAERGAAAGRMSVGQAVAGVTQFAGAGIGAGNISALTGITRQYGGALGLSIGDAQTDLASAFRNPAQGLDELSKKLGPFSFAVEMNVRQLTAQNRLEEARSALFKALEDRLRGTTDATGALTKAMDGAKGFFSEIGQRAAKLISAPTIEERIAKLIEQLRQVSEQERQRPSFFGRSGFATQNLTPAAPWERGLTVRGRIQQQIDSLQEQQALEAQAAWVRQGQASAAAASKLTAELQKLRETADIGAASVLARTAAEKLSLDLARIRLEAQNDANAKAREEIDLYAAKTRALAESARAIQDFIRKIADERYLGGATSPADRIRREIEIELQGLRETQMGTVPNAHWRSQVKYSERAGNLFNPSPTSPFAFPNNVPMPSFVGTVDMGALSRMMGQVGLLSSSSLSGSGGVAQRAGGGAPIDFDKLRRDMEEIRLKPLWKPILDDYEKSIAAQNAMLEVSQRTWGQSTYEVTRAVEAQRLKNEIEKQGIEVTDKMRERIQQLADQQGEYVAKAERLAERQRGIIESMDFIRSGLADSIAGPIKALARGENPMKALQQSGARMLDRFIDMQTNNLVGGLLGANGKAGGGLLGGLFTGLMGKQSTAMMQVDAAVVNIGGVGAIAGAGTGGPGGGLLGSIMSIFSGGSAPVASALGNAFSGGRLMAFASGGVVDRPTLFPMARGAGLMGEAGPEAIMPLRRGSDGKLGVAAQASGQSGGVSVVVNNHSNAKVETSSERGPDGRTMLRMLIREEVGEMTAGGEFDGAYRGRYGVAPRKFKPG